MPSFPVTFYLCSSVSKTWQGACKTAFSRNLIWRRHATYRHVPLPPELHKYVGGVLPGIERGCGTVNFASLDSDRVIAIIADPVHRGVQTFEFTQTGKLVEHPLRKWNYRCLRAFEGALIGYGYSRGRSMAYFPALSDATPATHSTIVRQTPVDGYQHMLRVGHQVFLFPECSWWTDSSIIADVVHLPSGRWIRMQLAPFRDKIKKLAKTSDETLPYQAVGATATHFVYRVHYEAGVVIGALFIPDASKGHIKLRKARVVNLKKNGLEAKGFVGRFSKKHPMFTSSHGGMCEESHVGAELLLYYKRRTGISLSTINTFSGANHTVQLSFSFKEKVQRIFHVTICRDPQPHPSCGSVVCAAAETGAGATLIVWDLHTGIPITTINITKVPPFRPLKHEVRVQIHKKKDSDTGQVLFNQFSVVYGLWAVAEAKGDCFLFRFGQESPMN